MASDDRFTQVTQIASMLAVNRDRELISRLRIFDWQPNRSDAALILDCQNHTIPLGQALTTAAIPWTLIRLARLCAPPGKRISSSHGLP